MRRCQCTYGGQCQRYVQGDSASRYCTECDPLEEGQVVYCFCRCRGCKEKKETSSESSQSETKQSDDKKRRKQDQKDGRKYEENRGKTTNSGSGEIPEAEDSEELARYIKMTEYIQTQLERNRNTLPTEKPNYKREKKARHDTR